MPLENQVVSLELAKKLRELGVKQESLWWWASRMDGDEETPSLCDDLEWMRYYKYIFGYVRLSAFTVAELSEMLPSSIEGFDTYAGLRIEKTDGNFWTVSYQSFERVVHVEKSENWLANAMASMLIYLKEQGLIK